jgi:hypothetical protein
METTLEMEFRLLRNFIANMPKTYRKRNSNWVIVKEFLQWGTSKGGSTSSVEKCRLLGIDPYGYSLEREGE